MNCQTIKDLVSQGAKIIDVRTEQEYANGHIQHSINIPLSSFEPVDELITKDEHLLMYCHSGARSQMAVEHLNEQGYNAINIGGINQYVGCIA